MGISSIEGDFECETGEELDGKRSSKKSGDRSEISGCKKFLVVMIESRLKVERPESVLESLMPMSELAEIIFESLPRC